MTETDFTKKFRKELMAGLSSLVLLSVLARSARDMYGYEIAKALNAEGEHTPLFKQGAIYPVLRSLEALGLLSSRIAMQEIGPPRRYYAITSDGRRALGEWANAWHDMRDFVEGALKGEVTT